MFDTELDTREARRKEVISGLQRILKGIPFLITGHVVFSCRQPECEDQNLILICASEHHETVFKAAAEARMLQVDPWSFNYWTDDESKYPVRVVPIGTYFPPLNDMSKNGGNKVTISLPSIIHDLAKILGNETGEWRELTSLNIVHMLLDMFYWGKWKCGNAGERTFTREQLAVLQDKSFWEPFISANGQDFKSPALLEQFGVKIDMSDIKKDDESAQNVDAGVKTDTSDVKKDDESAQNADAGVKTDTSDVKKDGESAQEVDAGVEPQPNLVRAKRLKRPNPQLPNIPESNLPPLKFSDILSWQHEILRARFSTVYRAPTGRAPIREQLSGASSLVASLSGEENSGEED